MTIAAAARQPRIERRRDAEGTEVGGGDGEVLGDGLIRVPPAVVPHVDADARDELVLHAGRELPVGGTGPPAAERRRVDEVLGLRPPKFESEIVPHSPPFASGLSRSQSGTKLLLASVQVRVTFVARFRTGLPVRRVAGQDERPTLTLIAVLPLPSRS